MNLLSIDLDYWNGSTIDWAFLQQYIDKAKVFEHHHAILKYVNKFCFENVVNVDYHSDIGDPENGKIAFNCGTWVNFLKYRKNYIWVYPDMDFLDNGLCHLNHNPFEKRVTDFTSVEMRKKVPNLNYDKVVIVLSREYTDGYIVEDFLANWNGTINAENPKNRTLAKVPKCVLL